MTVSDMQYNVYDKRYLAMYLVVVDQYVVEEVPARCLVGVVMLQVEEVRSPVVVCSSVAVEVQT